MEKKHSDWVLRFQGELRPLVDKYRGIGCTDEELLAGMGELGEELQDAIYSAVKSNDDNGGTE